MVMEVIPMKNAISKKDVLDGLGTPLIKALGVGGITLSFLAKKLKTELEATEVKGFNDGGKIVYSKPLEAWDVRQRARIDAQKLLGLYPVEKYEVRADVASQTSDEERDFLRQVAVEVAQRIRRERNPKVDD